MVEWVMIKNIGRFTRRNAGVVDYCIASPELLKLLFKLTDNKICSGAWTSENNLLLSRISKSNNNFRSSGLAIQ